MKLGYSVNKDFIYAGISVLFYLLHIWKILCTFALDLSFSSVSAYTLYIRDGVGWIQNADKNFILLWE